MVFNAGEVFQIGITIEKNGRIFYQTAAEGAVQEGIRKLFRELAEWETQHVRLFEELASRLSDADNPEVWDPGDEVSLYLKAAADSHIFRADSDPAALASSCSSAKEALKMAMGFEKDSVVFYTAMHRAVPDQLGKSKVERLITEELNHIAILSAKLQSI